MFGLSITATINNTIVPSLLLRMVDTMNIIYVILFDDHLFNIYHDIVDRIFWF